MKTNEQSLTMPAIGSDLPVADPSLDAYGYASFAKRIAAAVRSTPSPHGLVMAVHGPWGSGKSSLLNFVKHYLSEDPEDGRVVVIDFNPWWFDDHKHLAAQFLAQFKSRLPAGSEALKKIGYAMSEYSGALGKAVAVSTGMPWLDAVVSGVLRLFGRKPPGDVPKLKAEISAALKKEGRRFLFVIDDIDRLPPDDIRELFKVVKALADFQNVIYILSFDRQVVVKALRVSLRVDGEDYLEKIVQVPFVLPMVDSRKLQTKLFADLDRLLAGSDGALFDQTYFGNVFMDGMAPSIRKPRDLIRYVNALSVSFPAVRDEVNPTDFFALEFIRLTQPRLYDVIRENPDMFAGYSDRGITAEDRKEERAFHAQWCAGVDARIREGVQGMMERIFPRLSGMGHGVDFLGEWSRLRRAAHPDVFPTYFQFGVDPDRLSRKAVADFVSRMDDPEATRKTLTDAAERRRQDGTSKAKEYLDSLADFEPEIDEARASALLRVLGQIGDRLFIPADEAGFVAVRSSWRLMWAMQRALGRISPEKRDGTLISAFAEGESLTYLCVAVETLENALQKPVSHGPAAALSTIKPETVETLRDAAVDRIRRFAGDGRLLEVPELPFVLFRWRGWVSPKETTAWTAGVVPDPARLFRLLSTFLSHTRSQSMGDSVGRSRPTLVLRQLSEFVDLEKVAETLSRAAGGSGLDDGQRQIMTVFEKQYPLFKEGKDPDSPWVQMETD